MIRDVRCLLCNGLSCIQIAKQFNEFNLYFVIHFLKFCILQYQFFIWGWGGGGWDKEPFIMEIFSLCFFTCQ